MKQIYLIEVEDITGLEPESNFILKDLTTGYLYKGNGTASPERLDTTDAPLPITLSPSYKSATYSVVPGDGIIECDGTFTVTLPIADGWSGLLFIKNVGAGTITIDGDDGAAAIDGAANTTLAAGESVMLSINTALDGWLIISDKKAGGGGGGGTTVNSGEATLSFGSTPTNESSVTVTGQGSILATSKVKAWVMGATTASNNEGEHLFAGLSINVVSNIPTVSTGFTLYASTIAGYVTGDFKVKWEWI